MIFNWRWLTTLDLLVSNTVYYKIASSKFNFNSHYSADSIEDNIETFTYVILRRLLQKICCVVLWSVTRPRIFSDAIKSSWTIGTKFWLVSDRSFVLSKQSESEIIFQAPTTTRHGETQKSLRKCLHFSIVWCNFLIWLRLISHLILLFWLHRWTFHRTKPISLK